MKIDSIHLKNYRRYTDFSMTLTSNFNLLAGPNGSGKTTVLNGIAFALQGWMDQIGAYDYGLLQDRSDVRLVVSQVEGRFRFEPQYPVEVSASGTLTGQVPFEWTFVLASPASKAPAKHYRLDPEIKRAIKERSNEFIFPVVAYYRAHRHWPFGEVTAVQAAIDKNSRFDGYENWDNASANPKRLQTWFVAKCLERLQIVSDSGKSFDSIDDDELALVNAAIATTVESSKGLRFDLKQKSLLVEWQDRDPTPFENLSDGQRAIIAMVADIARRMCLLNPQLGREVIQKTPGVILIDELDMHLHPSWQRILVRSLKSAFPATQFIAASHSPQIIGELMPQEIILLNSKNPSQPQVSYGLDSSRVLEEIMGASPRSAPIEQELALLFKDIEEGNISQARSRLAGLQTSAPDLPEYARAEALLKRKEILGR